MVWPAGSPCGATEILMKIQVYATHHAPEAERTRINELVMLCMEHPASGHDANGNAYTEQDHCDSVENAWDRIRGGLDDWDACIEELEHLGSTGDTKKKIKGVPVLTKADEEAAKHFARRMIQYKWPAARVRALIKKYETKILGRQKKRVMRKAKLAKKIAKKKKS